MKRVLVLGCGDKKLFSGSVHLFRGLRELTGGEIVSATNADIVGDTVYSLEGQEWKVVLVGNRAFKIRRLSVEFQVRFDGIMDNMELLGQAFFRHKPK